jgi:alkylation response protein AidB-like acyl-CoA dehydrogenase
MRKHLRAGMSGTDCDGAPASYGFCASISRRNGGGAGGDFRHQAVLHEEMARRALSGMSIGVHVIVAHYLLNQGTEEQKRRYLPRMARIKWRHAHGCAVGGASASRNRRFESVPLRR